MRRGLWLPAGLAVALSGCAYQIAIEPAPAEASAVPATLPVALLVTRVDLLRGSGVFDVRDDFVNRVVMDLRATHAFARVLPPAAASAAGEDAVRLRLLLRESVDEHIGPNLARAIGAGLSMMLLAPFVSFEFGYALEIHGEARTCDDWTQTFRSDARGSLRYKFLSSEWQARTELDNGVTERALRHAVAQIASDTALRARVGELLREGDCRHSVGKS